MSDKETADINIRLRKSRVELIVSIVGLTVIVGGVFLAVANFYYHTNDSLEKLRDQMEKFEDKITRHDITIGNKVSIDEMREFKADMKSDMKDIKTSLNILLEKK